MPAQLIALNDGPNIWLDKPVLLIGRHPECDIQIDSRKISRRHCCIAQVNDYLVVRDLGSTNGVRINGERVLEGRLTAGDELTIGGHRYQVNWDSIQPETPPRGRHKETLRPPKPAPEALGDDDMLESSDQPIPLPDPNNPRPGHRPLKRAPAPADASEVKDSLHLPEIDLEPISDAFPNRRLPPSQSRPPG